MTVDSFKVRWNEEKTPFMKGHMHISVRFYNYVAKLPKTRKNMMFNVRKKFRDRRAKI